MAVNAKLIGKSLLKYLKPIRIGYTDRDPSEKRSSGFQIFNFNKEKNKSKQTLQNPTAQIENKSATQDKNEYPQTEETSVINESDTWINHVESIVKLCKKVSGKMTGRFGQASYKYVIDNQVRQKIKVVGSIVNVTSGTATPINPEKTPEVQTDDENLKTKKKKAA